MSASDRDRRVEDPVGHRGTVVREHHDGDVVRDLDPRPTALADPLRDVILDPGEGALRVGPVEPAGVEGPGGTWA